MFFKRKKNSVEWLIVGLGNPGSKYTATRHNVGFNTIDYLSEKWNIPIHKVKFKAQIGQGSVNGQSVLLLKPQTFMNLSGESIEAACRYYDIPPDHVILLFDDISLNPGTLRIRLKGSAGGHNGIKSTISFIGEDFVRIKIGVGTKPHPQMDLADWVLSKFTKEDKQLIENRFDDIATACELLMQDQHQKAMNDYNK